MRKLNCLKQIFKQGALIALSFGAFLASSLPAYAKEAKETKAPVSFLERTEQVRSEEKDYTINFDNVSIQEFLKFISRIADVNFIFNQEDLDFNVTIISEEPTDVSNVMSALIQVLRMHDLSLLEDNRNLVIHKNDGVRQIPTVVSDELPFQGKRLPPLVTKVFRIVNTNPSRIAALIAPMLSTEALVEVSTDTRQIIVTDITSNVERVAELLLSLDVPQTPFEVKAFQVKNGNPEALIAVADKIVKPMSSSDEPVMLVAKPMSNTVFIVSTPYLIERTEAILEELDRSSTFFDKGQNLSTDNILIYKLNYKTPENIERSLHEILQGAEQQGFNSNELMHVIGNMRVIKSAHAIMFVGPPATLNAVRQLLTGLDVTNKPAADLENSSFYLYEPTYIPLAELEVTLSHIKKNFKENGLADPSLIETIDRMQILHGLNAVLFTGDQKSISELKTLLGSIEQSYDSDQRRFGPSDFMVYKLKDATPSQIKESLDQLAAQLEKSGQKDSGLVKTIDTLKYIPESNSIIFIGHQKTLDQLKTILPTIDSEKGAGTFPIVIKYADYNVVEQALTSFASTLSKDNPAVEMIKHMKWIPSSHVLFFHGPSSSMKQIAQVIELTDTPENAAANARSYRVVKIDNTSGKVILENLRNTASHLESTNTADKTLLKTLKTAQYHSTSNSILLTGTKDSIAEAVDLIHTFDTPRHTPGEQARVFVYQLHYLSFDELKAALQGITEHALQTTPSLRDSDLILTIESMRAIPDSNSVQFVGSQESIKEVQTFLKTLDSSENVKSRAKSGSSFFIYKAKNMSAETLLTHLKSAVGEVIHSGKSSDKDLVTTLKTARVVRENNSIIFNGHKKELDEIAMLLDRLDSGTGTHSATRPTPESYELYQPTNVSGPQLITMVQNFEHHLVSTGVHNQELAQVVDHLTFLPDTGSILITGSPQGIHEVRDLLARFDIAGHGRGNEIPDIETIDDVSFMQYKLQYHQGGEIVSALKQIGKEIGQSGSKKDRALLDAISSIEWLQVTNSLLMSGLPKTLIKLQELIKSIDQPLRQVFIEVLVIETTVSNFLDFGLQWGGTGKYRDKLAGSYGNFGTPQARTDSSSGDDTTQTFPNNLALINGERSPTGNNVPFFNSGSLGVIGDIITHKGQTYLTLASLIKAVQNDGDITVALSQKVIAQDNRNTKVFSGDNIPFTGSLVTTSGLSQTTNANLEYRNVGITLSLTPYIGHSDIITLDIEEEISEQLDQGSGDDTTSSTTVNGIRTSKTNMQTRVHVPDKHFVILSGMIRNSTTRTVTKIPCLGGLPAIGAAFSDSTRLAEKKNIVIFVKPEIVDPHTDTYYNITNNQEDLLRSQANEQYFDEALDIVKTPENEFDDEFDDEDENFEDYLN